MLRSLGAITLAAMFAAPAIAGNYSARPMAPSEGRIITNDIIWYCGAAACQGNTQQSRPAILCQGLAKRAGRLEGFVADGRAFTSAELDRCNASARDGGNPAVAQGR